MRCLSVFLLLAVIYPALTFSARIVVMYSIGSKSHFFGVKPAIEALAERGHQVTLFTPFPGIGKGIQNVKEIVLPETQRIIEEEIEIDWFAMQKQGKLQMLKMFSIMAEFIRKGAGETLRNQEFRRIIAERDVDLFVVDGFGNEFVYPVIDLVGVPFVTHCAASPIPMLLATLGGPPEYASVPSPFGDFDDNMTFFQRLQNFAMAQFFQIIRNIYSIPMMDRLVAEEFPEAKPISEVEKNVSITIVNSHPTTTFPRSLPPTVIPIGALHTRPAKELPQDLKKFADESKHGFIVFTLGSFVPVSSMPKETAQSFIRVFSKLPLNVVWKWEAAVPDDVPSNVLMVDWIPQQDLLGHRNAKLFITHGGMMGTQEAIYHGVPMLGLPFGNDQRANIVKPKRDGFGIKLDWDNLNDDVIFSAINYLVYDPKARESAAKASRLMRDELLPGKDLAVYWMEYVMRNNGTKHLQLASKDMPFYKLYLLDVIGFLIVFFSVVSYSCYRLTRLLLQKYVFARQVKTTKTS